METFECDPQRLAKLDRRVGGEVLHQESDFFVQNLHPHFTLKPAALELNFIKIKDELFAEIFPNYKKYTNDILIHMYIEITEYGALKLLNLTTPRMRQFKLTQPPRR